MLSRTTTVCQDNRSVNADGNLTWMMHKFVIFPLLFWWEKTNSQTNPNIWEGNTICFLRLIAQLSKTLSTAARCSITSNNMMNRDWQVYNRVSSLFFFFQIIHFGNLGEASKIPILAWCPSTRSPKPISSQNPSSHPQDSIAPESFSFICCMCAWPRYVHLHTVVHKLLVSSPVALIS